MPARVYLNDAASAVTAIRVFSEELDAIAKGGVTPDEVAGKAAKLREYAGRTCLAKDRLAAQMLEDSRLEAQRTAVIDELQSVCTLMDQVADAAEARNARTLVTRVAALDAAVARLRRAAGGR